MHLPLLALIFVLLPHFVRPKVRCANSILHKITRRRRGSHNHPAHAREHLHNRLKMPIEFTIQARRTNGGHGILTGFEVGLDGTHGIRRFFVVGAEFDDEAYAVPHVADVVADAVHFGSEGGAGVGEGGEGACHVFVVGGEAGVDVVVLHDRGWSGCGRRCRGGGGVGGSSCRWNSGALGRSDAQLALDIDEAFEDIVQDAAEGL
mmetsp:Transcript_11063/g.20273  ORF Transcript_11063/g.20273 Transcript_11063/m.20273 type:complete len:205 (-) Transcript_11063:89-703(-)